MIACKMPLGAGSDEKQLYSQTKFVMKAKPEMKKSTHYLFIYCFTVGLLIMNSSFAVPAMEHLLVYF